jgi:hypothetical protein
MPKTKKIKKHPAHRVSPTRSSVKTTRTRQKSIKKRRRALLPFHKRIALHPVNLLFLLCTGVLLATWTYRVVAVSFTVTAAVDAPYLTQGAQITDPTDGQVIASIPIEITGTCPADSYVILTDNGLESGVGWCANNSFQIQDGLSSGANSLNAQDYNITDNPGPTTSNVSVNYNPPATTSPSTSGSTSTSPKNQPSEPKTVTSSTSPLLLTTNFTFQTVAVNQNLTHTVTIQGGIPPYQTFIDWGDGTTQTMAFNSDPTVTFSHVYHIYGYYPITLKVVDSTGAVQYLQTAAFVKLPGASSFLITPKTPKSNPPQISLLRRFLNSTKGWLYLIWPSYVVVLLMVFCFWLGEKEVYKKAIYSFKRSPKRHSPHSH